MTTAIDTNVVIALWGKDVALNLAARTALEKAFRREAWWWRLQFSPS